jgi:hypothetical protein
MVSLFAGKRRVLHKHHYKATETPEQYNKAKYDTQITMNLNGVFKCASQDSFRIHLKLLHLINDMIHRIKIEVIIQRQIM